MLQVILLAVYVAHPQHCGAAPYTTGTELPNAGTVVRIDRVRDRDVPIGFLFLTQAGGSFYTADPSNRTAEALAMNARIFGIPAPELLRDDLTVTKPLAAHRLRSLGLTVAPC